MDLVKILIQNTQNQGKTESPRQTFFKEFDRTLQSASQESSPEAWNDRMARVEQFGRLAGLSSGELRGRMRTLFWARSQTA